MAALPRVRATAPIHTDEEHDETGTEKEDTDPVECLQLFEFRLASDVEHFLCPLVIDKDEDVTYSRR